MTASSTAGGGGSLAATLLGGRRLCCDDGRVDKGPALGEGPPPPLAPLGDLLAGLPPVLRGDAAVRGVEVRLELRILFLAEGVIGDPNKDRLAPGDDSEDAPGGDRRGDGPSTPSGVRGDMVVGLVPGPLAGVRGDDDRAERAGDGSFLELPLDRSPLIFHSEEFKHRRIEHL